MATDEVVGRGLTAMLSDYPDRVGVIALPGRFTPAVGIDVVIYDGSALDDSDGSDLRFLTAHPSVAVIVCAQDHRSDLRFRAQGLGATHWLPLSVRSRDLVAAVEASASDGAMPHQVVESSGLSAREEQIVGLIGQGLSNAEIVSELVVSENTLKSHIRHAYAKMGVGSRSQAVSWAIRRGLSPAHPPG